MVLFGSGSSICCLLFTLLVASLELTVMQVLLSSLSALSVLSFSQQPLSRLNYPILLLLLLLPLFTFPLFAFSL